MLRSCRVVSTNLIHLPASVFALFANGRIENFQPLNLVKKYTFYHPFRIHGFLIGLDTRHYLYVSPLASGRFEIFDHCIVIQYTYRLFRSQEPPIGLDQNH
jgi:hypothetical protein